MPKLSQKEVAEAVENHRTEEVMGRVPDNVTEELGMARFGIIESASVRIEVSQAEVDRVSAAIQATVSKAIANALRNLAQRMREPATLSGALNAVRMARWEIESLAESFEDAAKP